MRMENGDRLTRVEFERRYEAMPELKKAELIEGVVYLSSPASIARQCGSRMHLITWLGVYQAHTPGTQAAYHSTVRLDLDNEPQPDGLLRLLPDAGGLSGTSEDDYVDGAPELVAEVAASSVSIDLHDKTNAYRRSGVREYIVWRALDGELDWFVRRDEQYELLGPDSSGVYKSELFPGLWLDVPALLSGDMVKVLDVLKQGIESAEHQTFVDHLHNVS